MKTLNLIFVLYIFMFAFQTLHGQDWNNFPIEKKKLTPDAVFYKTGHTSVNTNMLAINTSKGIVMVDALQYPEVAKRVRQMAESRFNSKVIYLINTHGSYDHTGGNSVFDDVPIIGQSYVKTEISRFLGMSNSPQFQQNWQRNMITRTDSLRADFLGDKREIDESVESAKYILENGKNNSLNLIAPDSLFDEKNMLVVGNVSFNMDHNTPSYSRSDIIIYIPREKILVVGDIFNKHRLPLFNPQTNLDQWEKLFADYISKDSDVKYFIGGHGDIMDKEDIIEQFKYLRKLFDEVGKLKNEGKTVEEATKALDLKTFPYLNTFRPNFYGSDMNIHKMNIMSIWRQLK